MEIVREGNCGNCNYEYDLHNEEDFGNVLVQLDCEDLLMYFDSGELRVPCPKCRQLIGVEIVEG